MTFALAAMMIAAAAAPTTTMLTAALATTPVASIINSGSSSSMVRTANGDDVFVARPFSSRESSSRDQERIEELCKNVWGGTDYVPEMAKVFEADPCCEFLVLEEAQNAGEPPIPEALDSDASPPNPLSLSPSPSLRPLVAAGNRRLFPGTTDTWWIEAIRVSESFRGRGIAGRFTAELCSRCRCSAPGDKKNDHETEIESETENALRKTTEILSCTIDQNRAMVSVFAKPGVDLRPIYGGAAAWTYVDDLKKLPGWSSSSSTSSSTSSSSSTSTSSSSSSLSSSERTVVPRNILQSFGLEDRIPESAKNLRWEAIETYEELASVMAMEQTKSTTTDLGYLPAFRKVLWPSEELSDSLRRGLVRKLVVRENDGSEESSSSSAVVWALVKDRSVSKDLRTQYVCSVAAARAEDLDAALWEACRPEYAERMGRDMDLDTDVDMNMDTDVDMTTDVETKTKTKTEGTHHPPVFRVVTLWPLAGTSATVEGIPFEHNNVFRFYRWRAGDDDDGDVGEDGSGAED